MTALRAGRVERCENLLHVDLSARHPPILVMAKEKAKAFFGTILGRAPRQTRVLRPSFRLPDLWEAYRLHVHAHRHS
jgi:hypothetical protein